MLFNSITFVVFLFVVLVVYSSIGNWRIRKIILLVASYLFYAAWSPPFVLLLLFSTSVDWFVARLMQSAIDLTRRRALLVLSLVSNLGLLSYFKYGEFLIQNFTLFAAKLGVVYQSPGMDIILPVGISFYTFQSLSYTLDVYRKKLDANWSFTDFALYVSFFPQLVAGPIVRASHFWPCSSSSPL